MSKTTKGMRDYILDKYDIDKERKEVSESAPTINMKYFFEDESFIVTGFQKRLTEHLINERGPYPNGDLPEIGEFIINFKSWWDEPDEITANANRTRMETDEEVIARLIKKEDQKIQALKNNLEKERIERELYETLKLKFGE